jgi:hypothetical protein
MPQRSQCASNWAMSTGQFLPSLRKLTSSSWMAMNRRVLTNYKSNGFIVLTVRCAVLHFFIHTNSGTRKTRIHPCFFPKNMWATWPAKSLKD